MRGCVVTLMILVCSVSFGQNKQLLYNFEELPQNLMSNPGAEVLFDMHIGLPFLSQLQFSAGSSGVSLHDIFGKGGGSINDKIAASLSGMTNKDFFNVNQQMEIIYIGWRDQQKRYYSGGVYQEMDAFLYFPKDIATLAYEGNKDHMNKPFRFSDVTFTAEVLTVYHLGFTNFYSDDFNYGVRAKLYSGIFNAHSVDNRGSFRTVPSPNGPNFYRHLMNEVDATVYTSGWASLTDDDASNEGTASSLAKNALLGGNLGIGVDLGFSYYWDDKTKITGSVIDLGFVNQREDIENYRYHGNYYTDGIELLFPGPGEGRPRYWDNWEDYLDEHLKDETLHDSYTTWRPVKFNASIDFGIEEDTEPCNCYRPTGRRRYLQHFGLQWFAIKRPKGLVHAVSLAYDKKFSDNLTGKITYTADAYSFTNVGILVSTRMKNFNFYLAADNILNYPNLAKAQNASVQLGFQLIFNRE